MDKTSYSSLKYVDVLNSDTNCSLNSDYADMKLTAATLISYNKIIQSINNLTVFSNSIRHALRNCVTKLTESNPMSNRIRTFLAFDNATCVWYLFSVNSEVVRLDFTSTHILFYVTSCLCRDECILFSFQLK
jgi:hypothetical protein